MPSAQKADWIDAPLLLALVESSRATIIAVEDWMVLARNTFRDRTGKLDDSHALRTFERRTDPEILGINGVKRTTTVLVMRGKVDYRIMPLRSAANRSNSRRQLPRSEHTTERVPRGPRVVCGACVHHTDTPVLQPCHAPASSPSCSRVEQMRRKSAFSSADSPAAAGVLRSFRTR
jgi:hypothetical protein